MVKLKMLGVLAGAVLAVGAGLFAAASGRAAFDAWFWMPIVWGATLLAGSLVGISRHGLFPSPAAGNGTEARAVPDWLRTSRAIATIAAALAGGVIASLTDEVFLDMPLSWWIIGILILLGIGAWELWLVRRDRSGRSPSSGRLADG